MKLLLMSAFPSSVAGTRCYDERQMQILASGR
jgi:hypothetical protein